MSERIVWKIDIESDELTASVRRLNTVSKNHIEKLIKKLQILDEIWQSLVDEPDEIIKGLIPVFENAAEWLIRKGRLKRSDCPIPIGRKRHLIRAQA